MAGGGGRAIVRWGAVALALLLAGLGWAAQAQDRPGPPGFPAPDRPVAGIISPEYSNEKTRDGHGEAERVLDRLGIKSGQRVADIGAALGYRQLDFALLAAADGYLAVFAPPETLPQADAIKPCRQ